MDRASILKRVLNKEVLRLAFSELDLFQGQGGENVHGEFGKAADWAVPSPSDPAGRTVSQLVQGWIQANVTQIENVCDLLLVKAGANVTADRAALIDSVKNSLISVIDNLCGVATHSRHRICGNPRVTSNEVAVS